MLSQWTPCQSSRHDRLEAHSVRRVSSSCGAGSGGQKRLALQNALGVEKVKYMGEPFIGDEGEDGRIDAATLEAKDADACIVFLGTSVIKSHVVITVSS